MEPLDDPLLLRWFVGWNMDAPIWEPSTCRKHRERLWEGDVAHAFFDQVLAQARERDLLSDEPCTVDGTLLEAWAGQKSCQRQTPETPLSPPDEPGNPSLDCRGERRPTATPASTDRSRGAAVPNSHRPGGQAVRSGPGAAGASPWLGGGSTSHSGDGDGRGDSRAAAGDPGRRSAR